MPAGSGFIVNGQREPAPFDLNVVNFLDDPALRLGAGDRRARDPVDRWVHLIVLHSSLGVPGGSDLRAQEIRPGFGPSVDRARAMIRYWTGDANCAGAHLIVDFDGTITCCADLQTEVAFHASAANPASIGIELAQGHANAELYEGQLGVMVKLCDWLTKRFQIQRQIPHRYVGPSRRLMNDVSDVVGIVGHRDLTNRRGAGDPGQAAMNRLGAAGYESADMDQRGDLEIWRRRQRDLGVTSDGVPGPMTCQSITRATSIRGIKGTRPSGIWIWRPGDEGDNPYPAPF
jgi:hypothetical protein